MANYYIIAEGITITTKGVPALIASSGSGDVNDFIQFNTFSGDRVFTTKSTGATVI